MRERNDWTEWKKGDGATVGYVSDYYPYTVVEVNRNGKEVVIQEDRKNRVSGSWPDFQYEYIRDPFGRTMTFTYRKNGRWRQKGDDMRHTGARLGRGRRFYQDPSF